MDAWKDLAAGGFGGACQLAVGHPFDTVKVQLQTMPTPKPGQPLKYSGAMDAALQTIRAEGAFGLYRGVLAPLATIVVYNAALFDTRKRMEHFLSPDGRPLTLPQEFQAGAAAGCVAAAVGCPAELIKCRLQSGAGSSTAEAMRTVIREEGALGLYRGMGATLLREVPGNALMFGSYAATKGLLAQTRGCTVEELGAADLVVAGGTGGSVYWGLMYPVDVIKSKIQLDSPAQNLYRGTLDAFAKVWRSEGLVGLYRGFSPCLARAFPANAACFLGYEAAMKLMS